MIARPPSSTAAALSSSTARNAQPYLRSSQLPRRFSMRAYPPQPLLAARLLRSFRSCERRQLANLLLA